MSKYICSCGGHINPIEVIGLDQEIYKDIRSCIDCDKTYIEKRDSKLNKKLKFISKAEFRRILKSRTP